MSENSSGRRAFWRNLPRLGYLYALIPLALLVGLYAGYGRLARLDRTSRIFLFDSVFYRIAQDEFSTSIPSFHPLPFYGISRPADYGGGDSEDVARVMLFRWKTQRDEAGRRAYYARYALLMEEDSPEFEHMMRQGERGDPDNALYPMLLANYYFDRGIRLNRISGTHDKWDYTVKDRASLDKGIAEINAMLKKRYFDGYYEKARRLEAQHFPRRRLVEDYLANDSGYLSPYYEFGATMKFVG